MKEMVDLAFELAQVRGANAELRLAEITDHRDDALVVDAPRIAQRREALERLLAHEHVDRPLALDELGHEVAADEPGCAGDEIRHRSSPPFVARLARVESCGRPRASLDAAARGRRLYRRNAHAATRRHVAFRVRTLCGAPRMTGARRRRPKCRCRAGHANDTNIHRGTSC